MLLLGSWYLVRGLQGFPSVPTTAFAYDKCILCEYYICLNPRNFDILLVGLVQLTTNALQPGWISLGSVPLEIESLSTRSTSATNSSSSSLILFLILALF